MTKKSQWQKCENIYRGEDPNKELTDNKLQ